MNEFSHNNFCKNKDPDNCSGCALTIAGNEGPNYAGWPLVYIKHGREIPLKWYPALVSELLNENKMYAKHLSEELSKSGFKLDYDIEKAKNLF